MKRKYTRRTILKAAGVSLALPLFEPFFIENASAAAALPPRFVVLYKPNTSTAGAYTASNLTTLPKVLQPLNAMKGEVIFLQGMNGSIAPTYDGHAPKISTFLTGGPMTQSDSIVNVGHKSLDQLIAAARGSKALTLSSVYGHGVDNGLNGAYFMNMSWASPAPDIRLTSPRALFDQIFGSSTPTAPSTATINTVFKKSIIDFVKAQVDSTMRTLGKSDAVKLDEYLTGVREIETKLSSVAPATMQCTADTARPTDGDFAKNIDLMIPLIVKALQCGKNDVVTYVMDQEVGFGYLSHHDLSHNGPAATLDQVDTFYVQKFANLIAAMNAIPEGDGTLLSNSLVLYGSGSGTVGIGNHDSTNLPLLLAGRAGGRVTPGKIMNFNGTTHCNLLMTLSQLYGLGSGKIGNGTGTIAL